MKVDEGHKYTAHLGPAQKSCR